MDEKGVMIGQVQHTRTLVSNLRRRAKKQTFIVQPGTRELVTIIECVSALGELLPPLIIFKAKQHQEKWAQLEGNRVDWNYALSNKGWTDNELGLEWMKLFEKASKHLVDEGEYRLLLLDNHGSHITGEMIQFAVENLIVLVAFPPHMTHLLQPLDVGCFSPLQRAYSNRLLDAVRYGNRRGVDKELFLEIYSKAREQAFTVSTIKSAWRTSGMNPVRPSPVVSRLDVKETGPIDPALEEAPTVTPATPRKQEDCQRLFNEVLQQALSSPIAVRVRLLEKAVEAMAAELALNKHQLEKYETYKKDKSSNKRLMAKGRVFTADDAKRLKDEKAKRKADDAAAALYRDYLNGDYRPELEVARQSHAVINPGEAAEAHGPHCHVFWASQQPPCNFNGRKWDARNRLIGAGVNAWLFTTNTSIGHIISTSKTV